MIEVMTTMVIVSIVVGIIGSNFSNISRVVNRFINSAAMREQILIFQLKFGEDYQQAEITQVSQIEMLDKLSFCVDYNLDGDYAESGEEIHYRWNKTKSRIERKSGRGNYQSLLEGIEDFSWARIQTDPPCHRMTLKTVFGSPENRVLFCRTDL